MRYLAVVTHNHGPEAMWTYRPGAPLAEATRLHLDADTPHAACEQAWVICNVDEPGQLPDALRHHAADVAGYRSRSNRSLSMGDVVILTPAPDGADKTGEMTAWAAADMGFAQIEHVPDYTADDPTTADSAAYRAMMRWLDYA